ncbi:unnamed protein product [Trifolium pratense]|uniref:Uncharacterized protein n=1 Tax=Trifolium pratense TaxID=57577 RepID=A0ACB0M2L0_TRIPR|nr:unnamed protein product [Trifolium pratense]
MSFKSIVKELKEMKEEISNMYRRGSFSFSFLFSLSSLDGAFLWFDMLDLGSFELNTPMSFPLEFDVANIFFLSTVSFRPCCFLSFVPEEDALPLTPHSALRPKETVDGARKLARF